MILSPFISAVSYKISKFLKEIPNFFEQDESKRKTLIQDLELIPEVKTYLLQISSNEFLVDLKIAVEFLLNPDQVDPSQNKLLTSCGEFLLNSFAESLDLIDAKFAHLPQTSKLEFVNDLIQNDCPISQSLKALILTYSHQEIYEELNTFLKNISGIPYVIIQTPIEINSKFKKDIRTEISKQTKQPCLPIFQVNKSIIGGMRIFIDGKVQDNSWLARINFITQIQN